ncbi:putative Arrestin-like protein [Trachipleistophora hominis]|uniref:Putative Arrestin-like protein n=1 Tax=Trachipleistophora hominis TaxID=72359 RepID=L7JZN9_TRAHO|nr:putative Arrestin-like protein [Trachipleistophora hominis]
MQKNCNFKITLDKAYFLTNEIVSGRIHLELLEPINLHTIYVHFYKKFECEFDTPRNDSSFTKKRCRIDRTVYNKEVTVYESFRHVNKLGSGYHVFPFKITLRSNDSGTCNLSQYVDNVYVEANNYYGINAFLKVEGVFKPVLTDSVRVEIRTYHQKQKNHRYGKYYIMPVSDVHQFDCYRPHRQEPIRHDRYNCVLHACFKQCVWHQRRKITAVLPSCTQGKEQRRK